MGLAREHFDNEPVCLIRGASVPGHYIIAIELVEARDVTVVAVTTDQELRAALGALLPKDGTIFADSPEQVLKRPAPNHCALLIVEQTLSRSIFDQLKSHLEESAPALVSIVALRQLAFRTIKKNV